MKSRVFGIFGKLFFYTCLILMLVIGVFFAFFHEQLRSVVTRTQQRQLGDVFQPLLSSLHDKTDEEVLTIVESFHAENRSFHFSLENADGSILYRTDGYAEPDSYLLAGNSPFPDTFFPQGQVKLNLLRQGQGQGQGDSTYLVMMTGDRRFYVSGLLSASSVFDEMAGEVAFAFFLLFIVSLAAAAFFARRIAKPIRILTANTRKMAALEDAPDFPARGDEIGRLAEDVYLMHHNLEDTIRRLEDEIQREREMEENQRYFFSAASHELKTPITAAAAILEGMAEGVVEPEEYPHYIRETLRLMNEQGALVTEILDIVKINDRMTVPATEEIKLSRFLETTLEWFHPLLEMKEQTLSLAVDEDTTVYADARLLTKALTNILQNATQNSPRGETISITARKDGEACLLSVENGGVFLAGENLSGMFEPFYVEDEARSGKQGRNGLGLTIVKKILDLMDISFALQNTENGVCFSMTLPCSS